MSCIDWLANKASLLKAKACLILIFIFYFFLKVGVGIAPFFECSMAILQAQVGLMVKQLANYFRIII